MTSERFKGSISIGKPGAKPKGDAEFDILSDAFREYGFTEHPDFTKSALMAGVAGAFAPEEMPPAERLPDLSLTTKQYFKNEVRPTLSKDAESGSDQALDLARKTGAYISAYAMKHPAFVLGQREFSIGDQTMSIDGHEQGYDIQTGWIIDYGMGLSGLMNHMDRIREEKYSVVGLQKDAGETALLEGIAMHRKLDEQQLQIYAGGITRNAGEMVKNGSAGIADAIIASRVHSAGSDLEAGIDMSSQLLRPEGLLVARGPRRFAAGTDYDKLFKRVRQDPKMRIVTNRQFVRRVATRQTEDLRSFVARSK